MNIADIYIIGIAIGGVAFLYYKLVDVIELVIAKRINIEIGKLLIELKKLVPAFNNYLALSNKLISLEEGYKRLIDELSKAKNNK